MAAEKNIAHKTALADSRCRPTSQTWLPKKERDRALKAVQAQRKKIDQLKNQKPALEARVAQPEDAKQKHEEAKVPRSRTKLVTKAPELTPSDTYTLLAPVVRYHERARGAQRAPLLLLSNGQQVANQAGYCLRTGVPGFWGVRFWTPNRPTWFCF